MAIYMKFGSHHGAVSEQHHKNWIALKSFHFGVGRHIASGEGLGHNRTASHASVSELTVTKELDQASLELWADALHGPMSTTVELHVIEANKSHPILKMEFHHVGVSSYSVTTEGARPTESLSLNFTKVKFEPLFSDAAGKVHTPKHKTWDVEQMKFH